MQKPILLILFLAAIQLTACSFNNATPVPTKYLPATPTITMTILPTSMAISTASPTAKINQCWKKLPNIPSEVTLPGKLVLLLSSNTQLSILDFQQNTQRQINEVGSNASVSPDGKWLSYFHISQTEELLTIESADGQVKTLIPTGAGWLTLLAGGTPWLDKERLWISTLPPEKGKSASMVIINPFTGKQQKILSNYPGLERYLVGMASGPGLHFGYSSVSYSPSLQLVAYPEVTKDGYAYITLWDRQSKKALARILDGGLYGYFPLWLPDGNRFVVVASPEQDISKDWTKWLPREWQMVNKDGTVRQLTHFHDIYGDKFEIGPHYSVSPDGNYLAFGLSQNEDTASTEPKQLMILNLKTLDVINTCISYFYPRPVWSPDSQYLAVRTLVGRKPSTTAIINLKNKWVADLPKDVDADPVGWLKFP